jgi:hypothetical protein
LFAGACRLPELFDELELEEFEPDDPEPVEFDEPLADDEVPDDVPDDVPAVVLAEDLPG